MESICLPNLAFIAMACIGWVDRVVFLVLSILSSWTPLIPVDVAIHFVRTPRCRSSLHSSFNSMVLDRISSPVIPFVDSDRFLIGTENWIWRTGGRKKNEGSQLAATETLLKLAVRIGVNPDRRPTATSDIGQSDAFSMKKENWVRNSVQVSKSVVKLLEYVTKLRIVFQSNLSHDRRLAQNDFWRIKTGISDSKNIWICQ